MSELRKAAQMALEALIGAGDDMDVAMQDAFVALRAALAQPEPEPVWVQGKPTRYVARPPIPPQRKPLTDEELMVLLPGAVRLPPGWREFARAIEKAHGVGGEE